jgi:hypothetical protein
MFVMQGKDKAHTHNITSACYTHTHTDLEEEDADELREDDGVGEIRRQDPQGIGTVVEESQGHPTQPHHHHRHTDHPLYLPV